MLLVVVAKVDLTEDGVEGSGIELGECPAVAVSSDGIEEAVLFSGRSRPVDAAFLVVVSLGLGECADDFARFVGPSELLEGTHIGELDEHVIGRFSRCDAICLVCVY